MATRPAKLGLLVVAPEHGRVPRVRHPGAMISSDERLVLVQRRKVRRHGRLAWPTRFGEVLTDGSLRGAGSTALAFL